MPTYIAALCSHLNSEKEAFLTDLKSLERLVQHVRDIIHLQQDYSRASGLIETVSIQGVIDDALQLNTELNVKYGIAPGNLTRIFQHGFTTRTDGHGFGLHSSAIAAREMESSLSVASNGLGKGASFTIDLPYRPMEALGDQNQAS